MRCPFYPDLVCTPWCWNGKGDELCPSEPTEDLVDEEVLA